MKPGRAITAGRGLGEAPGKRSTHCHQCSTALSTEPSARPPTQVPRPHSTSQAPAGLPRQHSQRPTGSIWRPKSNTSPKAAEIRVDFFLPPLFPGRSSTHLLQSCSGACRQGWQQLQQGSPSVPARVSQALQQQQQEKGVGTAPGPAGVAASLGGYFVSCPALILSLPALSRAAWLKSHPHQHI